MSAATKDWLTFTRTDGVVLHVRRDAIYGYWTTPPERGAGGYEEGTFLCIMGGSFPIVRETPEEIAALIAADSRADAAVSP